MCWDLSESEKSNKNFKTNNKLIKALTELLVFSGKYTQPTPVNLKIKIICKKMIETEISIEMMKETYLVGWSGESIGTVRSLCGLN